MSTKHPPNRLNISLVMATALCTLLLPSEKMLGATLTLISDQSFTDAVNFIDEASDGTSKIDAVANAESVAVEVLASAKEVDFETALLRYLSDSSASESVNVSLSLQSILGTLNQVNLNARSNPGEVPEIPILPQVEASDTFKEVYYFTAVNPRVSKSSNLPINEIFFSAKTVAPPPSLESLKQTINNLGSRSISLPSQGGALSFFSIPVTNGISINRPHSSSSFLKSLEQVINPLKSTKVDARFAVLPGADLKVSLKELNESLSSVTSKLDKSYELKINTTFRLLPKTILATSLDLTDDGLRKSTLIRNNLEVVPIRLQGQIQNNVQRLLDRATKSQNQFQQNIQAQVAQQKSQQQQFDQQLAQRQKLIQQRIASQQQNFQRQQNQTLSNLQLQPTQPLRLPQPIQQPLLQPNSLK